MDFNFFNRMSISILVVLFSPVLLLAGEPTERIKATTDKLIEIVSNPQLDPPEMAEKRARMIRAAVDEVFDWAAFSQRAMGKHWRKLTPVQKKEFIESFGQLLERTYMDKTRQYSGEKMEFLTEDIEGAYGSVEAEVILKNGAKVAVEYRVMKRNGTWFVYDVYVEGVSLVNNYRVQFNNIITRSSYEELLRRLKSKLDEE